MVSHQFKAYFVWLSHELPYDISNLSVTSSKERLWSGTTPSKPNIRGQLFLTKYLVKFSLDFLFFPDCIKNSVHMSLQTLRILVSGTWKCQKHSDRPTQTITPAPTPQVLTTQCDACPTNTFLSLWSDWLDEHCLGSFGAMGFYCAAVCDWDTPVVQSRYKTRVSARSEISGCRDADTVLPRRMFAPINPVILIGFCSSRMKGWLIKFG